jgi:hypothetical protein
MEIGQSRIAAMATRQYRNRHLAHQVITLNMGYV